MAADSLQIQILKNLVERSKENYTFGIPNAILYAAIASASAAIIVFIISSQYTKWRDRVREIKVRSDLEVYVRYLLLELSEIAKKQAENYKEAVRQLRLPKLVDFDFNYIPSTMAEIFLDLPHQEIYASLILNKRGDIENKSQWLAGIYKAVTLLKASSENFESKKTDFIPVYDSYQDDSNNAGRAFEVFHDEMQVFVKRTQEGAAFSAEEKSFYEGIDGIIVRWEKNPDLKDPYISVTMFEEILAESRKHRLEASSNLLRIAQDATIAVQNMKGLKEVHAEGFSKGAEKLNAVSEDLKKYVAEFQKLKTV